MRPFLPILFILISILLFIFVLNPLYKDVSDLKKDVELYNKSLSNSTNLSKLQNSLLDSYNQIKESDKEKLRNFLPDSVDNIQFILEVEKIANKYGMPIKDIKFEAVKKDNTPADNKVIVSNIDTDNRPYRVFPIEFSTSGSYPNFISFLKDLEFNLRVLDIKSITLEIPNDRTGKNETFNENNFNYKLRVETYWLK